MVISGALRKYTTTQCHHLSVYNVQYVILIAVTTLLVGGCGAHQQANGVDTLLMDSSAVADTVVSVNGDGESAATAAGGGSSEIGSFYLDKIGNFEQSIAAVFNNVAYGTTTTKRSIPDNVFVPGLTTIATPALTTYR